MLELLLEERLSSGLAQKAICDRLGKPKNYLIKVEKGEGRLDIVEMFSLCEAIGVDSMSTLATFAAKRKS